MDVSCVGDVNVDLITSRVKNYPARDAQIILDDLRMSSGGCSANFAKAAAILGLKTRLIGNAGKDLFGEFLRKDLDDKNLDLRLTTGDRTGATVAVTFRDGTRSFLTYPGANSRFNLRDIDFDLIEGRYLHVAGFFLQGLRAKTKKLLDYAHVKDMLTCFDTGYDPRGWSKKDVHLVRKVLRDVDIFFPNYAEAKAITGLSGREEVCDFLIDLGPSVVALKMGSRGSYIRTCKEGVFIPSYKVDVVDSTGAGDVFGAAFVYGHMKGWDTKKTGRFANAAAAFKTKSFGSEKYPCVSDAMRLARLTA
jgi:2-dehydro-3-deoxygluconokinase